MEFDLSNNYFSSALKDAGLGISAAAGNVAGAANTVASNGSWWDTIGGAANTGLSWLGDNKDGIGAAAGLAGAYFQYDLANQQLADSRANTNYQRSLADAQTANMATGFTQGYVDPRKEREAGVVVPTYV